MNRIILPHVDYRQLKSYQNCVILYEATVDFCEKYLQRGDRTVDQMIQAARSGKQNIVEGSTAANTSLGTEIKLFGVARASLEELLEDYRDYLRKNKLPIWEKGDTRVVEIRRLARGKNLSLETYREYIGKETRADYVERFCNVFMTLICQTTFLLDRHLAAMEENFKRTGGIRERMFQARTEERNATKNADTEEALSLLRDVYREVSTIGRQDLMEKVKKAAEAIKRIR